MYSFYLLHFKENLNQSKQESDINNISLLLLIEAEITVYYTFELPQFPQEPPVTCLPLSHYSFFIRGTNFLYLVATFCSSLVYFFYISLGLILIEYYYQNIQHTQQTAINQFFHLVTSTSHFHSSPRSMYLNELLLFSS